MNGDIKENNRGIIKVTSTIEYAIIALKLYKLLNKYFYNIFFRYFKIVFNA